MQAHVTDIHQMSDVLGVAAFLEYITFKLPWIKSQFKYFFAQKLYPMNCRTVFQVYISMQGCFALAWCDSDIVNQCVT